MRPLLSSRPGFLRCLLCLAAIGAGQAGALAAPPAEPYGRNFVRAGASWPAEVAVVPAPPAATDPALVEQLRERMAELERRDGPFAASLSEPLSDLARALDGLGLVDEARAQRARAIHLVRINAGLQSPDQLPMLREQLAADRRAGDFQTLDERYEYYHRLLGNGLPPYTPERFAATLDYLRWQREALRRELTGDPVERLAAAMRLADGLLERLPPGEQRVEAALSQLRNYYLLADLVDPPRDLNDWDEWGFGGRRPRSEFDEIDPRRERLRNLRRGLQSRGDDLLGDLLADAADLDPAGRARLLRERADWLQWWGRAAAARELYRRSWDVLVGAGLQTVAAQWYGEPRPLPDNGVFLGVADTFVDGASLDIEVDAGGAARATLLEDAQDLPRGARSLTRRLRQTRFRPALVDGEPVASRRTGVRFLLPE